jgi:hydroxymethylbilane synthase
MTRLRIATRGSDLATAQCGHVARAIEKALGVETELVVLKTTGDRLKDVSLAAVGGKGLFVKEIEEALLDGRADVAVHSAKDLPAAETPGLTFAAFPPRGDPRDALVCRRAGATLADLPAGARVGTGSTRRTSLLKAHRSDLVLEPLRGNVPTRLQKLEDEALDAVILACAGLERLGLADRIDERMDPGILLPAVGQGTLAVQARAGSSLAADLQAVDDAATRDALRGERAFLTRLGGDCTVPLAAYAEPRGDTRYRFRALVASEDGSQVVSHESEFSGGGGDAVGRSAAETILASGGREILDSPGSGS